MDGMTEDDWFEFVKTCPKAQTVRGGSYCILDGIKGYCSYHSCPERTGRI